MALASEQEGAKGVQEKAETEEKGRGQDEEEEGPLSERRAETTDAQAVAVLPQKFPFGLFS